MAFTSLAYAVFLPLALLAYFAVPARGRWAVLLAFSYGFYMSWHPQLILLLWLDTLAAWAGGLALGRARTRAGRGAALALGALPCLGALFFFKYFAFAAETLAALLRPFGVSVPQPAFSLVLPLGISFYTFQALGYLFDVWRAKAPPERHLGYFALFLGFFPQLVSGPIGRAGALLPQLRAPHRPDPARFNRYTYSICTGLFKKVVIADFLAVYADNVFDALTNQGGLTLILAAVLFSLQLYCDFAGYSDIAIGSARLFGITLAENFQSPYMARSVKEFWRRWHISLSRWFSDYVYIPLGGSRCRRGRHLCNLLVTFLCSGLWHGASWTFVLWGLYHGLWLCAETFYLPRLDAWQARLPRPAARALTVARTLGTGAVVCFGWGAVPCQFAGRLRLYPSKPGPRAQPAAAARLCGGRRDGPLGAGAGRRAGGAAALGRLARRLPPRPAAGAEHRPPPAAPDCLLSAFARRAGGGLRPPVRRPGRLYLFPV